MELESFTLVFLRRPADAPALPEERLDELQEQHLANLTALRERGVLLLAGPFDDQPDESMRGLCIFTSSLDETRELMARDPSVAAGRLAADVMTWWTARGSLRAFASS